MLIGHCNVARGLRVECSHALKRIDLLFSFFRGEESKVNQNNTQQIELVEERINELINICLSLLKC